MCSTKIIEKIVSGGQTGVDRASLDIAIKLGIHHGGWCPKGRLSEAGVIPKIYELQETLSDEYSERTILNIRDSDGTLIIRRDNIAVITDGTILTAKKAIETGKPLMIVCLNEANIKTIAKIVQWILDSSIKVLNVAGPRESQSPGIYNQSSQFIEQILSS